MIYLRYLILYAPASIFMTLVGFVVVPLALLCGGVNNRLPRWAYLWDNDIEPWGDFSRKNAIETATGWRKAWLRFKWLAVRNPANNFGVVYAIKKTPSDTIEFYGDQLTSDQYRSGWKFNLLKNGKRTIAFEFYIVWAYSKNHCFRGRFGWKLSDDPARLVFVPNPFMTFKPFTRKEL